MALDSRQFRNALGCFATGITVVSTTSGKNEPIGITVNSFSSVSLDPPLVLFSLARDASRFTDFAAAKHFSINVLSDSQRDISNYFASSGQSVWSGFDYTLAANGCPVSADALAVFNCECYAQYDGGDHIIVVGQVTSMTYADAGGPLIYYKGRYSGLTES